MTRGRKLLGIALLCAFAISAIAADGASATGTTAVTCTKVGGGGEFKDAHCIQAAGGTGSFSHATIAPGKARTLSLSNEKTNSETTGSIATVLAGVIAGTHVEVKCETVSGGGSLTNEEIGGAMQVSGTMNIENSNCTMKPSTCTVTSPIVYDTKFKSGEMGLEYTPRVGTKFGTLTVTGCSIAGSYPIEGSFEGTPNGATISFTEEMCKLKWGGIVYTLAATITLRESGGEPIAFTT